MESIVISVVAPMYNESGNIDAFFSRLRPVLDRITDQYEIVCINDGSTDDTLERLLAYQADDPRVLVLDLSRNFGKEAALSAGLDHARGQAVVPIDADLQDPPELIQDFVARWREGYEVVYATRRSRQGENLVKLTSAGLFYRFINRMSAIRIPEDTGDFRLMDRRVVEVLKRMPERTRFMKGLFAWVGFKQAAVEFDRDPRLRGRSKWRLLGLWRFAIDGITSFSSFPLKIWSYMGAVIALLSFSYMAFLILRHLATGVDVPGYSSLISTILFLGGIQLIGIGILGEYLGRVFDEVKRRPLYVVRWIYGQYEPPSR